MCNATSEAYDSEEMNYCLLLVMEEMKQLCGENDTAKLYKSMQYKAWQPLYDIDYGGSPG